MRIARRAFGDQSNGRPAIVSIGEEKDHEVPRPRGRPRMSRLIEELSLGLAARGESRRF